MFPLASGSQKLRKMYWHIHRRELGRANRSSDASATGTINPSIWKISVYDTSWITEEL